MTAKTSDFDPGYDPGFAERARARASWPVRIRDLGDDYEDEAYADMTPAERVALVWELSRLAWSLSGRPFPEYDRASMPVRVLDGFGNDDD